MFVRPPTGAWVSSLLAFVILHFVPVVCCWCNFCVLLVRMFRGRKLQVNISTGKDSQSSASNSTPPKNRVLGSGSLGPSGGRGPALLGSGPGFDGIGGDDDMWEFSF